MSAFKDKSKICASFEVQCLWKVLAPLFATPPSGKPYQTFKQTLWHNGVVNKK